MTAEQIAQLQALTDEITLLAQAGLLLSSDGAGAGDDACSQGFTTRLEKLGNLVSELLADDLPYPA